MSLFQKVKIILQLLFIGTLFLLNAAVYQKYNYFAQARHLSYIPKSAVFSLTVNANRLAGKMLYRFVYHNEEIVQLLEDLQTGEGKGNVLQSGIDLSTQLSFVLTHASGGAKNDYALVLFDLSAAQNAQEQLQRMGFDKKAAEGVYSRNRAQYASLNNEIMALFIFRDSTLAETGKVQAIRAVMDRQQPSGIDTTVARYLRQGSDVVMYGLPQNLMLEEAWMNRFIAWGEFSNDAFAFNIDFDFKRDVTSYFPENRVNEKYDFDNLDGYLYVKTSLYATNASRLIDKISFFKSDSLREIFVPVLHNQLAEGFELYAHGLKKAELKLTDSSSMNMRQLSENFYLPDFAFRLNCSDPKKIDTLLSALEKQGRIVLQPDRWYAWQRDRYYKIYMALQNDWLNITTRPDAADKMPETGYSNVIYFDSDHFGDKLPGIMSYAFNNNKKFDHFLLYSTGVNKNVLHAKGKLVLKEGSNALVESAVLISSLPDDLKQVREMFGAAR